jgi:hypothetical protein
MTKFGAGSYPSLGVSDGNIIILTYQSKNLHHLYQLTGDVIPSHKTIEWQGDVSKYSDGEMNAVGIDTGLAVAVHRRYNTTLYYGSAPFSSLKNWIWDLREEVKDLTLKEIVLPSSHDASMYGVTRCLNGGSTCNTVTQTHSIREQLLAGCRWFDIRPYLENDDTYSVGHWAYIDLKVLGKHWAGCNNGSLAAIFRQFKDYYDIDGGKDFVVLQFTNYIDPETEGHYHFTAEQMEALIKWVSKELDGYLFMPGSEYADRRLTDLPLEVFLTSKGKIIPVFKGLDGVSERPEGIYTYQQIGAPTDKCGADVCVFDNYSNTASVDELKKDQLAKYRNTDNHSEDWLYMLSWTLTQTPLQAVFCYILGLAPTILDMAKDANSELFPTLADLWSGNEISYGHMPNLISVDAYSARIGGAALWLTSLLLTAASGADLKSQAL